MKLYHERTDHYFYFDNCGLTRGLGEKELEKLVSPILRLFVALNANNALWNETEEWEPAKYNFSGARSKEYELKDTLTENLEVIAEKREFILADITFTEHIDSNARLDYFREHFDYMSMGINHGMLYYTFVNFRPDTINVIYPILMPSILYTAFRQVLKLKKSLNLKELDPKLVKVLDNALGTLRYAIIPAGSIIDRSVIQGWGYHMLTGNKELQERYKVYARHVIHATLDETYEDPIVF